VASTYRWQDAVQRESEVLLLIKTTEPRLDAVAQAIREASSYELPEFVAVRVDSGSPAYLVWLAAAVTGT
jgi:periplasmic divalent cation tolerance protein